MPKGQTSHDIVTTKTRVSWRDIPVSLAMLAMAGVILEEGIMDIGPS